jgi:hypothetical protein
MSGITDSFSPLFSCKRFVLGQVKMFRSRVYRFKALA